MSNEHVSMSGKWDRQILILDEKWMIDTWMLDKWIMNVAWMKNMDVKKSWANGKFWWNMDKCLMNFQWMDTLDEVGGWM